MYHSVTVYCFLWMYVLFCECNIMWLNNICRYCPVTHVVQFCVKYHFVTVLFCDSYSSVTIHAVLWLYKSLTCTVLWLLLYHFVTPTIRWLYCAMKCAIWSPPDNICICRIVDTFMCIVSDKSAGFGLSQQYIDTFMGILSDISAGFIYS